MQKESETLVSSKLFQEKQHVNAIVVGFIIVYMDRVVE